MANQSLVVDKSLSFRSLSSAPTDPVVNEVYQDSTTGNLLKWDGSNWVSVNPSANFANAYTTSAAFWTSNSTSYSDPTATGTPAIMVRISNGIALTQAGNNYPGITFTPASNSSVYLVTAVFQLNGSGGSTTGARLYDGSTVIGQAPDTAINTTFGYVPVTISNIYKPFTASPVTLRIQISNSATSTGFINGTGINGNPIEWMIHQIY